MNNTIKEADILALRERVKGYLTGKRYAHTLAVEREACFLGKIYLPEKTAELRCAALLHDITKKCDLEKQLQYCSEFDIIVGDYDILSPKTFHAKTASALIKRDFPDYASDDIVSGVRWHTTGHDSMTVFEAIVYLADYIEDTRTFADCVALRKYFRVGLERGCDREELLTRTMIKSFDMTVRCLIEEGAPVDTDTITARSFYIKKLGLLTGTASAM
ncbi:MAG: HD domain-containing protein [Clostridia bacterium]|nr:HD domain-containing protein [Clostridia bacterium]